MSGVLARVSTHQVSIDPLSINLSLNRTMKLMTKSSGDDYTVTIKTMKKVKDTT